MDARAGSGVGRLLELAVALVVTRVRGMDRRPARAPARAETDVRSVPRPSRGAPLAMLLIAAVAAAVFSGCAPATPPTTGATGPAAPAGPIAEPPPATAQPPQTPTSEPVASVLYTEGTAITKTGTVTVDVGSQVTVRVLSDIADEVHLHGYDRRVDASPGQEVGLSFTADTPGLFTVELENAQAKLVEVEVV